MTDAPVPAAPEDDIHEQKAVRLGKRERLIAERVDASGGAYPVAVPVTDTIPALRERYADLEAGAETGVTASVAGRVVFSRNTGKLCFASLQSGDGSRIQAMVSLAEVGEESLQAWKELVDLGDHVSVTGQVISSRRGELSIMVSDWAIASKALLPLPNLHTELSEEGRVRSRFLDLIVRDQARDTVIARSKVNASLRRTFDEHGFLEVETPMMHPIPGGASARPFKTHHNALDMELFLRIAPELYLKKLVVGGFEKVFELNRNFRNEGMSPRHNPEFTMMEFYEAYSDYRKLMDFTEGLLRHAAREALGTEVFVYQGRTLDLSKPFDRLTMVEAIRKHHPKYTLEQLNDAEWLKQKLTTMKAEVKNGMGLGTLQLLMFEETAEADLWDPTFIIDYPAEISPLARSSDANPEITERFELFIVGREIANAFSELNDPEVQAERFMQQAKAKDAGDEEAMYYDADYIRALEYGLPPTGGCGIGIDRLVMLLTDSSNIRDVILFPQMRPE